MSYAATFGRPKPWRYVVLAAFVFPVLAFLWLIFDFRVLHPELATVEDFTMLDKLRWIGVPLLTVAIIFGGSFGVQAYKADARQQAWNAKAEQLKTIEAELRDETARREYVLEVIGLGVTVEKYRQGKLWDVLQTGTAFSSIRETDPKKYAWSHSDKIGVAGGRACDALENGADPSPMYWGVPTLYAGSRIDNPEYPLSEINPVAGLAASAETTGMAWHLFVTGKWRLSERPDDLLEEAFAMFDAHPDLPYVVLLGADSMALRELDRGKDMPEVLKDGYYIPEMSDATAVFVLARRERVEPLRPYVWDDPQNQFLQHNLRKFYYDLRDQVPTPEKLAYPQKEIYMGRMPTVAEWLKASAHYAKNPLFEDKNSSAGMFKPLRDRVYGPPKDWKPTRWFPIPWSRDQMATFDRLPSLGFIHRPVFVKFEDEQGKPVTRRAERQKLLEAGWQQALHTLPEAARTKGPARIIGAFANNVEQRLALEGTLHRYAEQGGPEIDTGKPAQYIDTDRRLGDTGASTFFVQMALGVMGSYIDGGASAAVNLRDPSGASIVFISPPTAEKRKEQGELDVFKHRVAPAIDPANYDTPTVGDIRALHEPVTDAVGAGKP